MDLSAIGLTTNLGTFALLVEDDAMKDAGINNHDVVILQEQTPKPGDIVCVLTEKKAALKRYAETEPVQGVVVGLIRRV